MMTYGEILEASFNIAWQYLYQTGELKDPDVAARFLTDKIEDMMRAGERRKILLGNRAIEGYRQRFETLKLVS